MRERLLVRHFLQRFVDHDLLSPHADRRQVLTVTCGLLVASSLFLSVLLAVKYQLNLFMPPGLTALVGLDDRFLLVSLSMIVMGLLAATEWDALALDARDVSVLGHLPVPRRVIIRAKFIAVALFATAFVLGWNAAPVIVRPAALPVKLPVTMSGVLALMTGQALTTIAAGVVAFLAVLGIREVARALLGQVFHRISGALQALLVVFFVAALLLVPGSCSDVGRFWIAGGRALVNPPLWFVGLHESFVGGVIDQLPRTDIAPRLQNVERNATRLYRGVAPMFPRLAARAAVSSIVTVMIAIVSCAWNNRRLPMPDVGRRRQPRLRRLAARVAARVVVHDPASQAGFFFTLQSLSRSVPHRVAMAISVAVGVAFGVVILSRTTVQPEAELASVPVVILAMQTLLVAAPLVGFRHAVRLPSELRANWAIQLAWSGDERQYLTGVKRAAFLTLAVPPLTALSIWTASVLGAAVAIEHLACGLVVMMLLIDMLFLDFRALPFASGYVPSEGTAGKALYAAVLVIGIFTLAVLERRALATLSGTIMFFASLVLALIAVRAVDATRRRTRFEVDFDARPSGPTQRLELVR